MPNEKEWDDLRKNITWSMTANHSHHSGKSLMRHAANQGNVNFMGEFKNGYYDTQPSAPRRNEFDSCAQENQGRVYNIGRAVIGLPPV